jgi:hypothetical protein
MRIIHFLKERRGVPKLKLHVILNGTIGSPRLSAEEPQPKVFAHPAILFVGGLHPRNGVDILINPTLLAEMRTRSRSNLGRFTVERASEECLSGYDSVLN